MKLNEWAEAGGLTDRQIAEGMTGWLAEQGIDDPVSVPAVQKYRVGERIPKPARMRAIYHVTGGWVQPNDFFDLAVA